MLNAWKRIVAAGTSGLLLFSALIFTGGGTINAAEVAGASEPDVFNIVALGDSITVGYEPGMDLNSKPYGFTERLLEQGWYHGRTSLANYGILGLTTSGLRNYTGAVSKGTVITGNEIQVGLADPRIEQLAANTAQAATDLKAADLITITIGGNDMSTLFKNFKELTAEDFQLQLDQRLTEYTANMKATLENIRAINPKVTILLADQYQPAPRIYLTSNYLKLMDAAARLTATVDNVAASMAKEDAVVQVVHVAESFAGKEGGLTYVVKSPIDKIDIHPTQSGYELIARVFAELLWGEYRTPAVAVMNPSAAPMSIVVKGVELNTPNKPILKSGQNFLALKDVLNAVGATGKWDNKTSSATIVYGGRTVIITIGSKVIKVNGQKVAIDTPAFLQKVGKEDKTYLPLAALASGLGFDVKYSAQLRTAFINP
ncbi:MAG: copper amine oxidase [Paenibacillus sp.]|nr:copper amine oxidase [Paenibacillus sp.]